MATLLLLAAASLATPARADEAGDAAAAAYDTYQNHCADLATSASDSQIAARQALVTDAWRSVVGAYDRTGQSYLLYWRGVLSHCLNQEERAAHDLELFVYLEQLNDDLAGLVSDARSRLKRMQVEIAEPSEEERQAARAAKEKGGAYHISRDSKGLKAARASSRPVPAFLLGVAGGYQRTGAYNYGGFGIDGSFRLVRFLRLEIQGRGGVSVSYTDPLGQTAPVARYMLLSFGVGPMFEFSGPVRPRVGVLFQAGINPAGVGDDVFLPGVNVHGGVELPLGASPVALRPYVEIGNLATMFTVRAGLGVVIGVGS